MSAYDDVPATAGAPAWDEEAELRKRALQRLEDKRGLQAHVLAYVLVNAFLIGIWFLNRADDAFFWPLFPLLGWGIGLAFHVWSYVSPEPSEADIRREMDRLRGR